MRIELTEMVWLEDHVLSLPRLAVISGLPPELLEELVSCGAIMPIDASMPELRFGSAALRAARHARRLRADFELDTQALLYAMGLLDRIQALELQLAEIKAKLPSRQPFHRQQPSGAPQA